MFRPRPSPRQRAGIVATLSLACAATLAACTADLQDPRRGTASSSTLGPSAASMPGGTNASSVGPTGGPTGGPTSSGAKACAEGQASAAPVTPTVWLVVDGSGSMEENFGNTSRWDALRSALMDPTGVVQTLQSAVRFGLVIYNGPAENLIGPITGGGSGGLPFCYAPENVNPLCLCITGWEPFCCEAQCGGTPMPIPPPTTGPAQCENLVVVEPALSNHATIDAAYPAQELGGSTPTHRALQRIVSTLPVVNTPLPDAMTGPTYVVLATDGEPNDLCFDASGGGAGSFQPDASSAVLDAVRSGVDMGMRLFVVSLAGDDARLREHLQAVAEIGTPGQPPFEPAGKDELVKTLQSIVGGATCQIALNGTVQSNQACTGTVIANGEKLPCNDPNGWRLVDERTLQLTGTACDTFLSTKSLVQATFPCGVFVPQ